MVENAGTETTRTLQDVFILESHLASTRSADCYKAREKESGQNVCVWVLRYPLDMNSGSPERFMTRMDTIRSMGLATCPLQDFGVDSSGMAYAVFPALDGFDFTAGRRDLAELERRLTGAIAIVDAFHAQDLVIGDLSASSFWLDRGGDVWLLGVLGSFDADTATASNPPPIETLPYLAPEQRAGGGIEKESDVFALGVLGYRLMSGHFPYGDDPERLAQEFDVSQVRSLSSYDSKVPVWGEEVLRKCLQPTTDQRYPNAGAVRAAIAEVRQRVATGEALPARVPGQIALRPGVPGQGSLGAGRAPALQTHKLPTATAPKGRERGLTIFDRIPAPIVRLARYRMIVIVIAVFMVSLILARQYMADSESPAPDVRSDLSLHGAATQGNVKQVIEVLEEQRIDLAEKTKKLEELIKSDDPLAHDVLVKTAIEARSPEMRGMAEKAVVDRARRLGMIRSSEQLKQWLRTIPSGNVPSSYSPLLSALNSTLPLAARCSELRAAYAIDPKVTLRMAAAVALDSSNVEDYQELLSQLVGDSLGMDDAKTHTALGLILGHPELALVFSEDVIARRTELDNADILWLLKLLADRNDFNVRAFASLALERGILPPIRRLYLTAINEREDLPADVVNSLVRAAAGAIKVEDIGAFGRWIDSDSARLLLVVCADVTDRDVLTETFDILAGKSISIQPSGALIDWLRKNHWDRRADFARPIGVLANIDSVPEDEVLSALGAFDAFAKDTRLINLLVETRNPLVTRLVVRKYSSRLSLGVLLNLLDNSDREVRKIAVGALEPYHDVGALKIILDHYGSEKDPEVLEEYKKLWVIQNRTK